MTLSYLSHKTYFYISKHVLTNFCMVITSPPQEENLHLAVTKIYTKAYICCCNRLFFLLNCSNLTCACDRVKLLTQQIFHCGTFVSWQWHILARPILIKLSQLSTEHQSNSLPLHCRSLTVPLLSPFPLFLSLLKPATGPGERCKLFQRDPRHGCSYILLH